MARWLVSFLRFLVASFKSRRNLLLENLALRHQLLVLNRTSKQPRLMPLDRALWAWLSITIPDSVTSIGEHAFNGCYSLARAYFAGEAPEVRHLLYYGLGDCPSLIVYYRPGTRGWGSTLGGRPTALWMSVVPDMPAGCTDKALKLLTSSPAPARVRIQRSTDLVRWEDWQTVSRDEGPGELQDSETSTVSYRFYRGIEE